MSKWTDETVELLKSLWVKGDSAAEIAKALGGVVTRNGVLGKIHRLGLSGRREATRGAGRKPRETGGSLKARIRRRLAGEFCAAEPLPKEPPKQPEFLGVTLLDLKPGQCRFPRGEEGPYFFCGQPVQDGSSYCPYCHDLTHKPLIERKSHRVPATKFAFGGWAA